MKFWLNLLFLYSTTLSAQCNFNLYWGHKSTIKDFVISDINNPNVCVIGQACNLGDISGDIKGLKASIGSNGNWIDKIGEYYNGGLNPLQEESELPLEIQETIAQIRINNSEIQRIDKKNASWFKRASDEELLKKEKLLMLNSDLRDIKADYMKKVNAVGFLKLTEHNWITLLLSALEKLDSEDQSCSKVKINFHCKYDGTDEEQQTNWDKRIKWATTTEIKNIEGKYLKESLRFCSEINNLKDNSSVQIHSVPLKCNSQYEFDKDSLIAVYNGCKELFLKYSLGGYQRLVQSIENQQVQKINSDQRNTEIKSSESPLSKKTKSVLPK